MEEGFWQGKGKRVLLAVLVMLVLAIAAIAWTPPSSIDLQNYFNLTRAKNIQVLENLTIGNISAAKSGEIFADGTNIRFNSSFSVIIDNLTGSNTTSVCVDSSGRLFRC